MSIRSAPALLIVDVQHDFCPGGALPVREGDRVVPVLRQAAQRFTALGLPVYASRDWHPADSTHFAGNGGTWPVHCVQGTPGARLREDLELPSSTMIVTKGRTRHDDGYSAVVGEVTGRGSLLEDLQARGVTHLYVGGLATDYCVKHSVLDALGQGYAVTVLTDAIRAVDVTPGDGERALAEMIEAGARLATSADLPGATKDA
jgi:nicotinamidase/pyrazinamidase